MNNHCELFQSIFIPSKPGSSRFFDEKLCAGFDINGSVMYLRMIFENDAAPPPHADD